MGNHCDKMQGGLASQGYFSCNRQGLGVLGIAIQGNEDVSAGKRRGTTLLVGMSNQDWNRTHTDDPLGDASQEQVE